MSEYNKLAVAIWNGMGLAFEKANIPQSDAVPFTMLVMEKAHQLLNHGPVQTGKGYSIDVNNPEGEVVQATLVLFADIEDEPSELDHTSNDLEVEQP